MKKIGILGGMGPEATAEMYLSIIKYYQTHFGAKYDNDFPAIIIYSVPIPDVVENIENEELTRSMLTEASQTLDDDGCDFIIIACNTVQFLLEDLRKAVKIPILGIAEVNLEFSQKAGYKSIGILATKATIQKGVYQSVFERSGAEIIVPTNEDQLKVTTTIMAQLAGKANEQDRDQLDEVIFNLQQQGSEAILLACTDLPLVIQKSKHGIPLINCSEVYAEKAAKFSHNQ